MNSHRFIILLLVGIYSSLASLSTSATLANDNGLKVKITLPADVSEKSISGRMYLFTGDRGEPRMGPNWFSPQPFYRLDVNNLKPGDSVVMDDQADGMPGLLSELKNGPHRIQALLDHDFYSPSPGSGVGNFYSEVKTINVDGKPQVIELTLTKVVPQRPFPKTRFVKLVELKSKVLADHHQREVIEKALVILPASYYKQPKRRYPVFYEITGFGGTIYNTAARYRNRTDSDATDQFEYIQVILTGECKWGHHVYADSAINGPRGKSLTTEMIPQIDSRFRTVNDRDARYVGGHSSGGWSSIWLQFNYPDTFGGLWSTAPDPVDFRDYQQTNLYATDPESIYYFPDGKKKPLARRGSQVMIWYPDFAKMDDVLERGGQLRSFEAVFSPLNDKGLPAKMWDRKTGKVNSEVVEHWKKYDLNLMLRKNWNQLKDKLAGRVHILMGTEDTFYLDGATKLLGETFKELKSDADVKLIPGSHGSILTRSYMQRRQEEMKQVFLKKFKMDGSPK